MTSKKFRLRCIQDVIYGYITVSDLATSIIDTMEFQMLRKLRQLGIVHYVFPSANHTRFEHSIGVYHLAGVMIDEITKLDPENQIDRRLREIIKIAGLVHDIGHISFSHLFDNYISADLNLSHHEQRSCDLLRYIVKRYDIKLNDHEIDLIIHLISGTKKKGYPDWIFQIISNSDFDFDVDKCDYLVRDTYYLGMKSNLQIQRIFQFTKIINNKLCFHEKIALQIADVFISRYRLHKEVYRHPVVIGIELMVVDIMKSLAPNWINLFNPQCDWRMLTDDVIEKYNDPIYIKILHRDLYYKVDNQNKQPGDIEVNTLIGFTSKMNDNPIKRVDFYTDDGEIKKLELNKLCSVFSNITSEQETFVYRRT